MHITIRESMGVLMLLVASLGHAQDGPNDQEEAPADARKERAGEHVKRAGGELRQAGEAAGEQTREALHEAKGRARRVMQEAREQTREALQGAQEHAEESTEEARALLKEARERARSTLEQARKQARTLLEEAREHARAALLSAAESLESEEKRDERVRTRSSRQQEARAERWGELNARVRPSRGGPLQLKAAMKGELRTHARRTAQLARIRAVAEQAGDTASVARVDALLARELERHEHALKERLESLDVAAPAAVRTPSEEHKP